MMFPLIPAKLIVAAIATVLPLGLYQQSDNAQYALGGKTPAYAIQYYSWGEPFQAADAMAARAKGTEVFAELHTCGWPCSPSNVPVQDVIAGDYDGYLRSFAEQVRAFGHPVLLTVDSEMNGNWNPWGSQAITRARWKALWDHVTAVIAPVAVNATWVWAPNVQAGASAVAPYWPGSHHHVGAVGLDGYFWTPSSTWANTFAASVTAVRAVAGRRPFIVSETGVNSADPDAAAQIKDLVAGARSAGARVLFYFDRYQWQLTAPQARLLVAALSRPAR